MIRHLLALVLVLAGGAFPKILRYSATYYDLMYPSNNPASGRIFKTTTNSDSIILTVSVDPANLLPNGSYFVGQWSQGSWNNCYKSGKAVCANGTANVTTFEQNNCNSPFGKIKGQDRSEIRYVTVGRLPSTLYCTRLANGYWQCYYGSWNGSSEFPWLYYNNSSGSGTSYSGNCMDIGDGPWQSGVAIKTTINSVGLDTCSFGSAPQCNLCAWPYLAKPDTIGCGCIVDRSKYQSPQLLQTRVGLYCATYSDGSGNQFYLDQSRSNFNSSKGEIKGACSSPMSGKTVYMPSGTCPTGTRLTDTLSDTTSQSALGTIGQAPSTGSGGGSGSDTAIHSRLDSILGYLRDTTGLGELWQEPNLDGIGDSLQAASAPISARIDSLGLSRNGSSGPWLATEPWPDTIHFTYENPILGSIDTTLIIPWVIPGFPIDLWATLRWIEWVFVTLGMIPLMVRIAGGNEDA